MGHLISDFIKNKKCICGNYFYDKSDKCCDKWITYKDFYFTFSYKYENIIYYIYYNTKNKFISIDAQIKFHNIEFIKYEDIVDFVKKYFDNRIFE